MHERLDTERPTIQPPEQGGEEQAVDAGMARTAGEGAGDVISGALGGVEAPATGRPPETL